MKIEYTDMMGWIEYEVTVAMTPDDLNQLRLALSLAEAHGVKVPIIREFLDASENV